MDSSQLPEVAAKGQLIYLSDLDCLSIRMPGESGSGAGWQHIGDVSEYPFAITYVGPIPPAHPNQGDHWLNTANGQLLTWSDDEGWVDAIGGDQITNIEIAADTITATEIMAGTITASEIAADAITVDKLDANAITSKHTITGAVIRTSASGNRLVMRNDGFGGVLQGTTDSGEASYSQLNPGFAGGRPTIQLRAGSMTGTPGGTLLLYGDSSGTNRRAEFNCATEVAGDLSCTQQLTVGDQSPTSDSSLQHAVWGGSGVLRRFTSSARYKDDIEDLDVDVHQALKLRPRQYKDKFDGVKSVGFIAEEAADLGLDRWVGRRKEDNKPEAFSYLAWTAVLQKVCQQQQRDIDELKHQVATLQRMVGRQS